MSGVQITNLVAAKSPATYDRNILFIGIKDSLGTATNGELKENLNSYSDINAFYGRGSHIAQGLRYAYDFKKNGNFGKYSLRINAVAFNPVGTVSAASIILDGTATETKTITLNVLARNPKTLSIASGQTAAQVIAAINTLFDADLDLPYIVNIDGTDTKKLNFTANQEGTFLHNTIMSIENLPAGITITSITNFTGGAYTGLDITSLRTTIAYKQYDSIAIEKDLFDLDAGLKSFFQTRQDTVNNIYLCGQVVIIQLDTYNNVKTSNALTSNTFGAIVPFKALRYNPFLVLADLACIKEGRIVEGFRPVAISNAVSCGVKNSNLPLNNMRSNIISKLTAEEAYSLESGEIADLKSKGFLPMQNNLSTGFAEFVGNSAAGLYTSDGGATRFAKITDYEKINIFTKEMFYALTPFINKTLSSTPSPNNRNIITKEDIAGNMKKVIDDCAGIKRLLINGINTEIPYNILVDAQATLDLMKSIIDENVATLINGTTLDLGVITIVINQIIETIGLTNLFTNND